MKKKLLLHLIILPVLAASGQATYWQQSVNYKIEVTLNDQNHTLNGRIAIEYSNNSPDTLRYIWFHLWPNAYKNDKTALAKQLFRDKEGKKEWKEMQDRGYMDSLDFMCGANKLHTEADPANIDIIKVFLAAPLLPGAVTTITTPFFVKIQDYISRSGHIRNSYMICQWYPKPAVYDKKGWHPLPYLDQGEFYSEYGSFDVNITVPSSYVIGATGELQNQDELFKYRETGRANNLISSGFSKYNNTSGSAFKTLHYKGENIHDFAWFADKDFIIRYDTARLASGKIIDVFTYGEESGNKFWKKSTHYVEDAIRHYSAWIGEYPYPVAQAVEGPGNISSGGMEYPMITLITSPDADEAGLDGVIAHEVGHNWFYGILGSNERDHAWMDEGINTYYQFRYEAQKYKANSIFGNAIPADIRAKPVNDFQAAVYGVLAGIPMDEAIETPSADFDNKEEYGTVIYIKTAVWMYIMEASIGMDKVDKAIKTYFNEWKFRHPYPEDLKTSFEKELNIKMDDIFGLLNKRGKFD